MSAPVAGGLPFATGRDGIRLAVRLTPKASADRIIGTIADGRGGWALKVAVTAAPVDGKANAALLRLLARHFGFKPSDLTVVAGAGDRSKVIGVKGEPAMLEAVLTKGLGPWLRQG